MSNIICQKQNKICEAAENVENKEQKARSIQ